MGNNNYKTSSSKRNLSLRAPLNFTKKSPIESTNNQNINNWIGHMSILLNECLTNQLSTSNNLSILQPQNIAIFQKDNSKDNDNIINQTKYINSMNESLDLKINGRIYRKVPTNIDYIDEIVKLIIYNNKDQSLSLNNMKSTFQNISTSTSDINSNNITLQSCSQKNKTQINLKENINSERKNNSIASLHDCSPLGNKNTFPTQTVIYSVTMDNYKGHENKSKNKTNNLPEFIGRYSQKRKDKQMDNRLSMNSLKKGKTIRNQFGNESSSYLEKILKKKKPQYNKNKTPKESNRNKTPLAQKGNHSSLKLEDKKMYNSLNPDIQISKKEKFIENKEHERSTSLNSRHRKYHNYCQNLLKRNDIKKSLKKQNKDIKKSSPEIKINSAIAGNSESQKDIFTIIQNTQIFQSYEEEMNNRKNFSEKTNSDNKLSIFDAYDENFNDNLLYSSNILLDDQNVAERFSFNPVAGSSSTKVEDQKIVENKKN